jgi:hypothetical protein
MRSHSSGVAFSGFIWFKSYGFWLNFWRSWKLKSVAAVSLFFLFHGLATKKTPTLNVGVLGVSPKELKFAPKSIIKHCPEGLHF